MKGRGDHESVTMLKYRVSHQTERQTDGKRDMWWLRICLFSLVHWIPAQSEMDHFLTYRSQKQEQLVTLEGDVRGEEGLPKVHRERHKRFLSFNNDDSKIRVEMVFAVPFLSIPIGKKDMEGAYGSVSPTVDVNVKSLITASVLMFMLFFVVPKLVRVFVPTMPGSKAYEYSEMSRVMRSVEETFSVNATSCWQQGLCSLVQAGRLDMRREHPSSWAKLVDGFSNIKLIEKWTEGTSLGEAVSSAKDEVQGCKEFFVQCPLRPDKLGTFASELARRYAHHLVQISNTRK